MLLKYSMIHDILNEHLNKGLYYAACYGHLEIVKFLLTQDGIDVNYKEI